MAGQSEDDEEFASDPEPDASADGPAGGEGSADPARRNDEAGESDDSWRFGVDEVDEDGLVQTAIEAEDPDLEHAVFVVLGALAMVLVFVHLWTLV